MQHRVPRVVGYGTALGVIRAAADSDKLAHVWVDETRPLLQGARLTAWELGRLGIPYTLVADATAGPLFARGDVDAVIVGADRIAANGDVANKIGTYTLAVARRATTRYRSRRRAGVHRSTSRPATATRFRSRSAAADEVTTFAGSPDRARRASTC